LINPTLIKKEGLTQYWEACASCLDNMGLVKRPYKITVSYQDTIGTYHEDLFEGFEATVLAHEIDHLDGILHMDIAEEVLVMVLEERRKFRQNNKYHIFSKTGDYEELKKQKTKKL
jgi:peptide deformylase